MSHPTEDLLGCRCSGEWLDAGLSQVRALQGAQ